MLEIFQGYLDMLWMIVLMCLGRSCNPNLGVWEVPELSGEFWENHRRNWWIFSVGVTNVFDSRLVGKSLGHNDHSFVLIVAAFIPK